jgi:hypothetical protein
MNLATAHKALQKLKCVHRINRTIYQHINYIFLYITTRGMGIQNKEEARTSM